MTSPAWYLSPMELAKNVVKRANETIGIVPSGNHRLTNLVRRLYSVILLFSQRQGDKDEYKAVLSEMLEAANSSGSNREQVKTILRDIRAIGVDWNVREGDRDIWKNVGLIEEPGLIDGRGTPTYVTWKLPKIIRSRLLDPHGFFTRISLETMTRLKSGASIALYEICCQYVSNDHGKGEGGLTFKGSLNDWMPRILGTRKSNYEYKFFKRDVLLPAIEEIQTIADLRVELIEHKDGRKVAEIQFRVFPKTAQAEVLSGIAQKKKVRTDVIADKEPEYAHIDQIQALGVPKTTANKIAQEYAERETYLLKTIALVEQRDRDTTAAPLRSKVAFFKQALREGYAESSTASAVVSRPLVNVQPVESADEVSARLAAAAAKEEIWTRYQSMSNEGTKKRLFDDFLLVANQMVVTFARKGGINNMVVRTSFIDWLARSNRI